MGCRSFFELARWSSHLRRSAKMLNSHRRCSPKNHEHLRDPMSISVHALRLVMGWIVTVNGSDVPMWVSAAALVVFAGSAVGLWREMRV